MNNVDIKKVFAEMEEIEYCLLRNYEFLIDDTLKTESLDIAVAQKDMERFARLLRQNNFIERKPHFSKKHRAFFHVENGKKISFDVQMGGVYWNDMQYMDEGIFERHVKKSFFYTLSDEDTCVMLIAHSILGKRMFKEKYQRIIAGLTIDKDYVEREIARIFSPRIAQQIIAHAEKRTLSAIKTYPLVAYFLLKKPLQLPGFAALFFRWLKWKRFVGIAPLISIVGPDGAGKTSLVESLAKHLEVTRNISVVYTGRGRGHLLPISRVGYRYKKKEQRHEKLKQHNERMRLLYILALPVFALDLWLRYIFLIFPQRLRKRIVITDRYCTDILLMQHVPMLMKKILVFFFPRPTLSVLLYNDASTLHERRKEESIEELERQLDILNKWNYTLRVKTTDKEKDTSLVIDAVITELLRAWW